MVLRNKRFVITSAVTVFDISILTAITFCTSNIFASTDDPYGEGFRDWVDVWFDGQYQGAIGGATYIDDWGGYGFDHKFGVDLKSNYGAFLTYDWHCIDTDYANPAKYNAGEFPIKIVAGPWVEGDNFCITIDLQATTDWDAIRSAGAQGPVQTIESVYCAPIQKTFDAHFESTSTVTAKNSLGTEVFSTSGRDSETTVEITANEGEHDAGTVNMDFSHELFRTDDNGSGRKAEGHWRVCLHGDEENCLKSEIKSGFATLYPWKSTGSIGETSVTEQVKLGESKSVQRTMLHSHNVTMRYDETVKDYHDDQKTYSRATVLISHPYNFKLKTDAQLNKDIVYTGETVPVTYNVYNDENDRPRKDISHTASPDSTITRVISFRTSDLDTDKLAGTGADGTTPKDPCAYFAGKGISGFTACSAATTEKEEKGSIGTEGKLGATTTVRVDDVDVSTAANKICVATAVKPAEGYGTDKDHEEIVDEWRISDASCRTIAKKPSVSFKAGNIYADGKITTSVSNKRLGDDDSTTTFGSWADHLAISRSSITHLASGSTLANGNKDASSVCDLKYSPLSIANSQCKGGTSKTTGQSNAVENGEFVKQMASLYLDSSKATEYPGGYISVGSGETRVYVSNTTLTIDGNIEIRKQNYTSAKDVPQVIIFAPNIEIAPNVTHLDAWLVAYGNSNDYLGGTIDTCTGHNASKGEISTDPSNCGRELVINGPLVAQKINFNRSAGAGAGESSKDPAENITLTPAAYVWGYGQSSGNDAAQAHTVYSREMAPRM